jgi:hypothetical protein
MKTTITVLLMGSMLLSTSVAAVEVRAEAGEEVCKKKDKRCFDSTFVDTPVVTKMHAEQAKASRENAVADMWKNHPMKH